MRNQTSRRRSVRMPLTRSLTLLWAQRVTLQALESLQSTWVTRVSQRCNILVLSPQAQWILSKKRRLRLLRPTARKARGWAICSTRNWLIIRGDSEHIQIQNASIMIVSYITVTMFSFLRVYFYSGAIAACWIAHFREIVSWQEIMYSLISAYCFNIKYEAWVDS